MQEPTVIQHDELQDQVTGVPETDNGARGAGKKRKWQFLSGWKRRSPEPLIPDVTTGVSGLLYGQELTAGIAKVLSFFNRKILL